LLLKLFEVNHTKYICIRARVPTYVLGAPLQTPTAGAWQKASS
jgi:hypothetical protein